MEVKCPVCLKKVHYRAIKVHLKKYHGYVYTDESPHYPAPPDKEAE